MTLPVQDLVSVAIVTDTTIAGWRAFYADGSKVDSMSTLPSLAPPVNAHAIMVYFKDEYLPGMPYRQIYSGYDTYILNGTTLAGTVDKSTYMSALDAAMAAQVL